MYIYNRFIRYPLFSPLHILYVLQVRLSKRTKTSSAMDSTLWWEHRDVPRLGPVTGDGAHGEDRPIPQRLFQHTELAENPEKTG